MNISIRRYARAIVVLGVIALAVAACGRASSISASHPHAKASVHAEASAVAGMPAAQALVATGKSCALANLNVLHPIRSYHLTKACIHGHYPGAPLTRVGDFANCEVKVYVTDHGNAAKENAGLNSCGMAAEKA